MLPKLLIISATCILLASCKGSRLGSSVNNENLKMKVEEKADIINYSNLPTQQIMSFSKRISNLNALKSNNTGQSSFIAPVFGSLVSLATDGIKKMIANDKKKFNAEYNFALTNMYFYDQLSTESVFDPVGMQFNGFKLVRTFKNEDGQLDTAMVAEFMLDTANAYEIMNDAIFRIRLKKLDMRYAKAKIAKGTNQHLNMDIEITFTSSYVNEMGQLFDKATLGKFYLLLREMPLNKADTGHVAYYKNLQNKLLDGRSFIVPRSFGYYINDQYSKQKCYSQGAYSIQVNVKESSKNSFVNKMIIDNSGQLLNSAGDQLKKMVQP
ncbi:MAG: hypothetical protein H7178_13680 [Chitinophagaceae bacterium]|nr:hypothetical protein [Chitinophagaceae bacterium]